jgi:hypothetical protein
VPKPRDRWDKLQILLDPIGKVLTALLVIAFGFLGNHALQQDQKRRAALELLSQREQTDGALRKDMFNKVIDQLSEQNHGSLDTRILNLELLAYNFHDSIDLGPLLKQIYAQLWTDERLNHSQVRRLRSLAEEIVARELVALREVGCSKEAVVNFAKLEEVLVLQNVISFDCASRTDLPARHFSADVFTNPTSTNLRTQTEVDVVLRVRPLTSDGAANERPTYFEFTVSPFDFPMINNVRLGAGGGRVSMVMTRVDDGGATLALVYFPDSRTSLKDRPFHDEVLEALEER